MRLAMERFASPQPCLTREWCCLRKTRLILQVRGNAAERKASPLFEIARVLVRFDHVAGPGKLLTARGGGASCGGLACYQRSPYAE